MFRAIYLQLTWERLCWQSVMQTLGETVGVTPACLRAYSAGGTYMSQLLYLIFICYSFAKLAISSECLAVLMMYVEG